MQTPCQSEGPELVPAVALMAASELITVEFWPHVAVPSSTNERRLVAHVHHARSSSGKARVSTSGTRRTLAVRQYFLGGVDKFLNSVRFNEVIDSAMRKRPVFILAVVRSC